MDRKGKPRPTLRQSRIMGGSGGVDPYPTGTFGNAPKWIKQTLYLAPTKTKGYVV